MSHSAVIPVSKLEEDFYEWWDRHAAKCAEAAAGNHDLVFMGDSITHLYEGYPAGGIPRGEAVWQEFYARRRALNLGFGWDRTQNVLWRLDHGEFAGQTPRLVVLLIGTNNLTGSPNAPGNTPAEIAEGIQAVCGRIRTLSPATRILLMGVLPRGASPADPLRAPIRELNTRLAEWAPTQPLMEFADIGGLFLEAEGSLPPRLMNDGVHPTDPGYRIWAEAIEPHVQRWVGGR